MGTLPQSPYITASIASRKYFFKSLETVERMCREGTLKTARKTTPSKRGHWQIARLEVIQVCSGNFQRE